MEFILDTNAYRNLVRGRSLEEVIELAKVIREKEREKGYSAGLPLVVAMELIAHLTEGDPDLDECFRALCLLFDHSKNFNPQENSYSGIFYPPLNVVLPKYFFNENGIFLDGYKQIIPLIKELTHDHNILNIMPLQAQINIIREQLEYEKKEIRDNLENYIKSINDGSPDWEYFKNNEKARQKWFKDIQSGKSIYYMAEGFMERAYYLTDRKYERTDENFHKLNEFHEKFYPALAMTSLLLEQVGHGTLLLAYVHDKKWNTVLDVSIMFGVLFNSDIKDKIFVTEEKKMHEFFALNNMQDKIIKVDAYLKLLGI